MKQKTKALLDAHVNYTLNQFNEAAIKTTVDTESKALQEWLGEVQFDQVISKERLMALMQDLILQREISGEVIKFLETEIIHYAFAPWLKNYKITDFFTKTDYDALANKLIDMDEIRNEVLHHFLHSSLCKQFIADISYHIIKQYVTEENIVAKNVPGVSSLMKIGNKAMNMAAPKLEAAFENTAKSFIKDNIDSTITFSEKMLVKSMDEGTLIDIAEKIFEAMQTTHLDLANRYIDEEDIRDIIDLITNSWDNLRGQRVFHEILENVIDRVFETAAKKNLGEWYEFFMFDHEEFTIQLSKTIAEGVKPAIESGYLEQRVRANLEPFYQSDAATKILAAD